MFQFLSAIFGFVLLVKPAMASTPGSVLLDPASKGVGPYDSVTVNVIANVGTSGKLDVAQVVITSDQTYSVVSCQAAPGFQGIAQKNPCTKTGNQLKISVETTGDGPSGEVPIASFVVQGQGGQVLHAIFSVSTPQVVIQQSDGVSVMFPITQMGSADLQFGQNAVDPLTPTLTSVPPSATSNPSCSIPSKSSGNANNDCFIDEEDYHHWLGEFINDPNQLKELTADFNGDGKVNLSDFEIWRRNRV